MTLLQWAIKTPHWHFFPSNFLKSIRFPTTNPSCSCKAQHVTRQVVFPLRLKHRKNSWTENVSTNKADRICVLINETSHRIKCHENQNTREPTVWSYSLGKLNKSSFPHPQGHETQAASKDYCGNSYRRRLWMLWTQNSLPSHTRGSSEK